MKLSLFLCCSRVNLILLFLGFVLNLNAQNNTKAGDLVIEPPTLICLGFEWYIEGDENRNATVNVQYRVSGEEQWQNALPLLRIGKEKAGYFEWKLIQR